MKIAFFEIEEWEEEYLKKELTSEELFFSTQHLEDENIDAVKDFEIISVFTDSHIGSHVIRIGKGFEMNVIAFDVHQDKKMAKQMGFTYVSLEDLLKTSNIISLHVPYNKHTHHLINSENVNLIKKGAYLINTARG